MKNSFKTRCWCLAKKNYEKEKYNLEDFVKKKLPIFWIIGPPSCGKTTLADMLAQSSKYCLLSISDLLKDDISKGKARGNIIQYCFDKGFQIPNHIVVDILKEAFIRTSPDCIGYVIDGFPLNLKQAKIFESEICKVSIIIYVTLILDAMLARKVTQVGAFDPNKERIEYIKHNKRLIPITKNYEQKVLKLHANYPPEDTCTRLVENLEDFWGFKFLRLYNKNE